VAQHKHFLPPKVDFVIVVLVAMITQAPQDTQRTVNRAISE
jgi:hypothetical protein